MHLIEEGSLQKQDSPPLVDQCHLQWAHAMAPPELLYTTERISL